jgi:dienelactone hydrolase
MNQRPLVSLLTVPLLAILLLSCGNDDAAQAPDTTEAPVAPVTQPPAPTTGAPDTTVEAPTPDPEVEPRPAPSLFIEPGPFPIGVTTLQLDTGPLVEIWYPAVEGSSGTVTYDVRDFTPPAIQEMLTGSTDARFSFEGQREAAVAEGRFPVVLFSHGFTSLRLQSSFLTSHLASHGMIVVAPDHPSRDLNNVLGGTASGDRNESVDDLLGSLDLILAAGADSDGPFAGRVDDARIAALGHSAGGGTVIVAALDERISGYVSMAAGGPAEAAEFPDTPSFFMAGAIDAVATPTERTRPAFEAAPTPSWYWELEATGHHGFDDVCTFGGGTGIIGIAEQSGLGGLLDAQPQLRALGEDGCLEPAAPVEQAFPIVRHGVTSWLRWLFGEDAELVGFDPEAIEEFELAVVALER